MSRTLFCIKLNQEEEAMDEPPFPGPLGSKIFEQVSKKAWSMWLNHQTMLINEYRLNLMDSKAREFLQREMNNYFFGEGSEKPSGYIPN